MKFDGPNTFSGIYDLADDPVNNEPYWTHRDGKFALWMSMEKRWCMGNLTYLGTNDVQKKEIAHSESNQKEGPSDVAMELKKDGEPIIYKSLGLFSFHQM